MKKRIKHTLNFILKEVILKYLFCYILSVIALAVPLFLNIDEPWNSWLISFSASIFSLPVIFIICMSQHWKNIHRIKFPRK